EADLKDPYMGPKLEEAFRGPGISPHDRTKLFNLIHERYLSEWGSRNEMVEIAARAAKAEKESHYASVRYQPEYAREQDQQQGYYDEDETDKAAADKASDSAAAAPGG